MRMFVCTYTARRTCLSHPIPYHTIPYHTTPHLQGHLAGRHQALQLARRRPLGVPRRPLRAQPRHLGGRRPGRQRLRARVLESPPVRVFQRVRFCVRVCARLSVCVWGGGALVRAPSHPRPHHPAPRPHHPAARRPPARSPRGGPWPPAAAPPPPGREGTPRCACPAAAGATAARAAGASRPCCLSACGRERSAGGGLGRGMRRRWHSKPGCSGVDIASRVDRAVRLELGGPCLVRCKAAAHCLCGAGARVQASAAIQATLPNTAVLR